jgi:hypothetical protein
VRGLLGHLDPGDLWRGTGRAERPGRSPRGVRGRAPAGVAGQRGSRRFWVAHWDTVLWVTSRAAEGKSRRNGIGPFPAGPNQTPRAAVSTLVLSASPRCPECRRDGQRMGHTRDRAPLATSPVDRTPHGLRAPSVHDHNSHPRRTGRVLASGTSRGPRVRAEGQGVPAIRFTSRHLRGMLPTWRVPIRDRVALCMFHKSRT